MLERTAAAPILGFFYYISSFFIVYRYHILLLLFVLRRMFLFLLSFLHLLPCNLQPWTCSSSAVPVPYQSIPPLKFLRASSSTSQKYCFPQRRHSYFRCSCGKASCEREKDQKEEASIVVTNRIWRKLRINSLEKGRLHRQ